MTRDVGRRGGLDEQAVLLVAGLADLAVTTLGSAVVAVRGLLRRSDAAELAAQAEQDLAARGRLVLDRYAAVPPAHLEVLARHALARKTAADD
ncbi:polyprenyl synthetase [Streptomyces barringtoniae]|uniref:polyprenyl synthetase n=1 Tax=Streptomyces barringtoniae TaxID=2892029 RepID=UPI001E2D8C12|nr:polyprenyl synthetase [Streptomyces barringtoniae]MCC5481155.1 polyprenyl synthetase [Streptomyces barringtoniae]